MKTVVVTGVAGGIGAATAALFSREGWRVIGIDAIEPDRDRFCDKFIKTDLSDESEILRLFSTVSGFCGSIQALVNNAAYQLCKTLLDTECDEWDLLMRVNLRAVFLMMKSAHPLLRQGNGSIVNIGSVHALATSQNIAAYAASKGGLQVLTRSAALEFARDGIRVNCVHPGAIDTEMLRRGLSRGHLAAADADSLLLALAGKTVMGRIGTPEEISQAVFFLADNQRSSFITGQHLVVDGGATARLSTE